MSNGKPRLPLFGLIVMAAIVVVAAGGLALYVTGGVSGNTGDAAAMPEGTTTSSVEGDGADCATKADEAKTLGAEATGGVAAMLAADPPVSLAGLSFNGPDGKSLKVADFAGKTLVFNLWATWCAPCRSEMPALDALQKKLGGDDFQVVAVNVDTGAKAKPEKFLDDTGVRSLTHYRENSLTLFNDLKTRGLALGLPVTLLIGKNGCLLTHMNGPAEWAGPDAEHLVKAALATNS